MTHPEFELFLKPSPIFLEGERQLIEAGQASIAKLTAFFTGEAKNDFGVEYRKLGQAMTCALETAKGLGAIARPLEPYLRQQLEEGNPTAAMALGTLGALEAETIETLIKAMELSAPKHMDLAAESAIALLACGLGTHPGFAAARAKLPVNGLLTQIINKRSP